MLETGSLSWFTSYEISFNNRVMYSCTISTDKSNKAFTLSAALLTGGQRQRDVNDDHGL